MDVVHSIADVSVSDGGNGCADYSEAAQGADTKSGPDKIAHEGGEEHATHVHVVQFAPGDGAALSAPHFALIACVWPLGEVSPAPSQYTPLLRPPRSI
jgi:hypothetical protein